VILLLVACKQEAEFSPWTGPWTIESFTVADDSCEMSAGDAQDPGGFELTVGTDGAFTVETDEWTLLCQGTNLDFDCEPVGWTDEPYAYEVDLDGYFTTVWSMTATMSESISCATSDCAGFDLPCTTTWDVAAAGDGRE
jgi:hypothetical protein